ncbi:MAG: patatin-like phospholipase family protein [Bacteroidales bacterium]|nr:patatin-like phospholipase family protein [Bacteroidales bacterium]
MLKIFKKYKYGLVLSGGAVRGIAHLGVLKALHEQSIIPGVVSGASAGSIAGAFYADGYEPEEILEILTKTKIFDYFKAVLPKTGFFRAGGLKKVLENNLRSKTIEELQKPLFICVTDILNGQPMYLNKGKLVDAVLASSCIPVLFEPIAVNGTVCIDGGIMDNLPVKPIENSCKKLIGVHVNPLGKLNEIKSLVTIAERAFHLAIASDIERKKPLFDIFIEPESLKDLGLFDLKKSKEIFEIGYNIATKVLTSDTLKKAREN